VWYFECPACQHLQLLKFEQLKWDSNDTTKPEGKWRFDALAETVRYECVACGHQIKDTPVDRRWIENRGRFVPQNPNAPKSKVSYTWNALLPHWIEWRSIVEEFVAAVDAMRIEGDIAGHLPNGDPRARHESEHSDRAEEPVTGRRELREEEVSTLLASEATLASGESFSNVSVADGGALQGNPVRGKVALHATIRQYRGNGAFRPSDSPPLPIQCDEGDQDVTINRSPVSINNHTTVSITSYSLKKLTYGRDYVSVEELEALVILMKSARAGLDAPLCGVCKEPQFETPSGVTCVNGHGGADPLEEPV
jgi:hypothetical protein